MTADYFDDDAAPARPRDRSNECEWAGCTHDATTVRPGYHRPMRVCGDHDVTDPRPDGNAGFEDEGGWA